MDEKTKILWLVNVYVQRNESGSVNGELLKGCGWLAYYFNRLIKDESYDFTVVYPQSGSRETVKWRAEGTSFYGF